jgi:hypothetical protein
MAMTEIPAFKLARNPELTCHANHKVADRKIAAVSVHDACNEEERPSEERPRSDGAREKGLHS